MKIHLIAVLICYVVLAVASQLPDINAGYLKNLNKQYVTRSPSKNCTVLEKQYGIPKKDLRLPHDSDCTKFYECNGPRLIVKRCPNSDILQYDPFHKTCDFKKFIPCITYGFYSELANGHYVVTSTQGAQPLCRR